MHLLLALTSSRPCPMTCQPKPGQEKTSSPQSKVMMPRSRRCARESESESTKWGCICGYNHRTASLKIRWKTLQIVHGLESHLCGYHRESSRETVIPTDGALPG